MPTAEEIREALENCSEDRCDEECACYMEDDCRRNHLSKEEARVVFGKSSGSNLISRQAVMNYLREQQAAVIIEKAKQNMITYDACKGIESSIEAFMNFINQVPADCGAEKVIAKEPNECEWTDAQFDNDSYESCQGDISKENAEEYVYCPYCGRKIKVVKK